MDIMDAIRNRRSIRRYKDEPVDDKSIETVLDAARLAPSWGNTQCWSFIVVRDSDTKAQLADSLIKVDSGDQPVDNPSVRTVRSAPVIIIACARLKKSGFEFGEPATDKGDCWYMYDVALAAQNLALAAHSLGLGTVTIGAMDAQKVATILEVPEGFCVVSMVALGHPDQEPGPRPRKELLKIVFYDKFGKSD